MTDAGALTSDDAPAGIAPGLHRALARAATADTLLVACDYDGTLAPIVDDPAHARPTPGTMATLAELAGMSGTWASLVSGRSLSQLVELAGPPVAIGLIGSHGAEHVRPAGSDGLDRPHAPNLSADGYRVSSGDEAAALLSELVAEVSEEVSRLPGSRLESKPVGVAFHYRQADPVKAAATADALVQRLSARPGVHVRVGKMVAEFAVAGSDKGQALLRLIDETSPDATVFIGDDVTDEDALAVLGSADVGIKVGPGATAAAHRVASTDDVLVVLVELARLRSQRPPG
ncbi:MAG: trehalose-phosphatase [Microthrixaceae bacterium]|nr:trehalose-phosphatase [Microthrixaceae bacterium]